MFAPRYSFSSRWELSHPAFDAYDALYRVREYPAWWAEFREVLRVGDGVWRIVVRSFLPYRITYMLRRTIADRATGCLESTVDGDIVGRIGWKIDATPTGSVLYFREEVRTNIDELNLLAPVARWAFEANHRVMMHNGHIGLRGLLAGRSARPLRPPIRRPGEGFR